MRARTCDVILSLRALADFTNGMDNPEDGELAKQMKAEAERKRLMEEQAMKAPTDRRNLTAEQRKALLPKGAIPYDAKENRRIKPTDVPCDFFHKMGACRHGNMCSRKHTLPTSSQTIVLPHLYGNTKESGKVAADLEWTDEEWRMAQQHVEGEGISFLRVSIGFFLII